MTKGPILTAQMKADIVKAYTLEKRSAADIAVALGIGATTVRRALHDEGIKRTSYYCSKEETQMLELLLSYNIKTASQLSKFIQGKGVA